VTDRADPAWLAVRNVYLVRVLLRSGFRRFEMHRARCADAVLDKGEFWTVGKGNIRDYVPLPASGINTLAAWLDRKRAVGESTSPRAFLFVTRADEPLSFGMIRLIWKEALGHAGLPLIYGIHTTRHTAGLIVFAQTGSLEKTARFLRHRSLATTARFYLHIDSDALRRELAAVDVWKDR
jgi:integrase